MSKKPQDRLEFDYLREQTNIILDCPIQISPSSEHITPFYVLTEDMDKIGIIRVREGKLQALKMVEVPKELILEGFGSDAWKYQDIELPFKMYQGGLKILKQHINMHESSSGLRATVDRVRNFASKQPQKSLVISTLDDYWETGLLLGLFKNLEFRD